MRPHRIPTRRSRTARRLAAVALLSSILAPLWLGAGTGESLADAIERGEMAKANSLLDEKADAGASQPDGTTALHWAVYRDSAELSRRLVAAGASVNAKNRYGVCPLALACENGNAAIVELLLERGADPNSRLAGGETALMISARTGRLEPLRRLLSRGAVVDEKDRRGQTALMWAAAEGHDEVVKLLLDAGADSSTRLRSGFTAFFFAVREGRRKVVKTFLERGVDVNGLLQGGRSAGQESAEGTSALLLAIENGHFELAADLLEAGANPDDERSGLRPLHAIVRVRKTGRGDDQAGLPPPRGSGSLTSLELARKLIERGADVNGRLQKGRSGRAVLGLKGATPFLLASSTADLPLLRLFLEAGANPNLPNAAGSSPLLAAAGLGVTAPGEEPGTEEEALDALRLLIEHGCDVNHVDENGETALHGAAYKNAPSIVEFLIQHGARLEVWNRENRWGWTPLAIAEGHRPGNFKPSPATIAAFHRAFRAAGLTPPPPKPRPDKAPKKYDD